MVHVLRVCLACALSVILLGLPGCVYAPDLVPVTPSYALAPDANTRIAGYLRTARVDKPRVIPVDTGELALTTRLDLIDAADVSIDLQYFLWHNDPSGILVIEKILAAADRGVRVRALVDDIQMQGLVNKLNALADHPNIDIRIFNPFSIRWRMAVNSSRHCALSCGSCKIILTIAAP